MSVIWNAYLFLNFFVLGLWHEKVSRGGFVKSLLNSIAVACFGIILYVVNYALYPFTWYKLLIFTFNGTFDDVGKDCLDDFKATYYASQSNSIEDIYIRFLLRYIFKKNNYDYIEEK